MNAMAEQNEAQGEANSRRRTPLPPELSEFLGVLDALEDRYAVREASAN